MSRAESHKRAAGRFDQRPTDFHFAFGFAAAAALLHTYATAEHFKTLAEFKALTSPTTGLLFLLMEFGLLLNVAGLWLRRVNGMRISLAALSVTAAGYVAWYLYSRETLDLLLSKPFYHAHPEAVPPHPFGLMGATWVNLVVLVMTGVLFIWEVKTLRGMRRRTP